MSSSAGLFIVSKRTLNADQHIAFPKGKWSGSIQFFTSGTAILLIDDRVNYPIDVDKNDVIEFHGLPITKLISKTDGLTVTIIASQTCEIPSIVQHKVLSEETLESIGSDIASIKTSNEAIKAQTDKLTFDASSFLRTALASDEVGLAKDSTLSSELTRIAKLKAYNSAAAAWQDLYSDGANRLKVQLDSLPNPSNLDVALSTLVNKFTNTNTYGSIASGDNTAGFSVTLEVAHRSHVEVWVKVSGAADIKVYGSRNGSDWRLVDSDSLSAAGEWHKGYLNGYPHIKVEVPTTGIDVEIELTANP